jgi:hypothetical protein
VLTLRPTGIVAIEKQPERSDASDILVSRPSIQQDLWTRWLAFAFVGLLGAMVIGFVSEIRPLKLNSPDYGYDEALEAEASSLSSVNSPSDCSGDGPATAGASEGGFDRRGPSAIAGHAAVSPTASIASRE